MINWKLKLVGLIWFNTINNCTYHSIAITFAIMNNQTWSPVLLVTTKSQSTDRAWAMELDIRFSCSMTCLEDRMLRRASFFMRLSSLPLQGLGRLGSVIWPQVSLIATLKQTEQWWPHHLWNTSAKKPMLTVGVGISCTAPSVHTNIHTSTAGSQRSTSPRFCTSNSRSVSEWTLLAPGLWGKIRAMSAETWHLEIQQTSPWPPWPLALLDPSRLNSPQAHGDGHISGVVHVQLAEDTFCFRHTLCTRLLGT